MNASMLVPDDLWQAIWTRPGRRSVLQRAPRLAPSGRRLHQGVRQCKRLGDRLLRRQRLTAFPRFGEGLLPKHFSHPRHIDHMRGNYRRRQRSHWSLERVQHANQARNRRELAAVTPEPHESMQVPGDAKREVPVPPLDQPLAKVSNCRLGVPSCLGHLTKERMCGRQDRLGIELPPED